MTRPRSPVEPNGPISVTGPEDFGAAFIVSRETLERLKSYAEILATWQKTVNLIAPKTLPEIWQRHFADSAQLLHHGSAGEHWLDLGSGAGFPGLVIAILLREHGQGRVTLVESDQRKAAFLLQVKRRLDLPVDILCARIEDRATQVKIPAVDIVTARALAPLVRLIDLAAPYCRPGTVCLFPKGRRVDDELDEARRAYRVDVSLIPSRTDPEGRIVLIRGLGNQREP